MTTQQQIDDPGQWRVGDVFEGESEGHPFSGPIWMDGVGQMVVGATYIRNRDGAIEADVTGHVTRTIEPIPEPTVPWALVRFADGEVMWLVAVVDGVRVWTDPEGSSWEWVEALDAHGAPVAVSLPRWSDEVDGLRAGIVALAAEWERVAYEAGGSTITGQTTRAHADRLCALLAQGGEA